MRLCVFEDQGVRWLEPLTLTRPAFDLPCGVSTLLQKQRRLCPWASAGSAGALVRPLLAGVCREAHAELHVNDGEWLRAESTVLVNARWLPSCRWSASTTEPALGMIGEEVAYAVLTPAQLTYCSPQTIDDCLEVWSQTLPRQSAGGQMIHFPWDLVECHPAACEQDFEFLANAQARSYRPANLTILGPSDRVLVHDSASVEPHVVADTTKGPVIIAREARVQAFSRIEGPCYVGPGAWLVAAQVRGSCLGPVCRVGGEVEASILLGHTNKYHDGFLGHSVVGEWVNIAAGVQVSDLRNDYGPVTITCAGNRLETGRIKVGACIGDHTRIGLGALVNTGSVFGSFCNLLPTGMYLPRDVPSFTVLWNGRLIEQDDLTKLLVSAETAMRRRGCELSHEQIALYEALFEETSPARQHVIRAREQRRLRQSA